MNLPWRRGGKQALALWLAAGALVAGCGGSGGGEQAAPPTRQVFHADYVATFPGAWAVEDYPRQTIGRPEPDAVQLLKVASFPLARAYRPALWPTAVGELDRVAAELARKLDGRVESSRTVTVAGRRGREYRIGYASPDYPLVQRIAFVLRGRREYQLTCRYRRSEAADSAGPCALLLRTFRLT